MDMTISKFQINLDQRELDYLVARLRETRWPDRETVDDWSQGVPLTSIRDLCDYWAQSYDWRRCERRLNALGQFTTEIDGLGIHFLHIRSPCPEAKPLLMTHGWPGSVVEFLDVIEPLTNPEAHGGVAGDAFHVVLPSLPGFGFSGKPTEPGWTLEKIAFAWATLMARLGYDRYFAQGGDWGAILTTVMASLRVPGCVGIHLNAVLVYPGEQDLIDLTPGESAGLAAGQNFEANESGYFKLQTTRPQTIGYALHDSPAAQAAWIYEKLHAWSDNDGVLEDVISRDAILDNIMMYWITATATSSARMYWQNTSEIGKYANANLTLPVGATIFPKETIRPSRRWAARHFSNIVHWNEVDRGGHFAAFEQPGLFVDELRACFRRMDV